MTTAISVKPTSKSAKAQKLQSFRVVLYGGYSRPMFKWNGKAVSASDAEQSCFDTYHVVLKALCQTQGLKATPKKLDLEPQSSDVQSSSGQEGWQMSFVIPEQIKNYQGASLQKLPIEDLQNLVSSGALTDPVCRDAARGLEPMRIGFWFSHAGGNGMRDIGTCLLIKRPGRQVRHHFTEPALREALRFLLLRTSVPFMGGTALPSIHPFRGPTAEVVLPSSAVVRALLLTDPPKPPSLLIDWLDREGYTSVADRLHRGPRPIR